MDAQEDPDMQVAHLGGMWSLWTTQASFPNFAEWQKESGSLPLTNSQIWLCFKDGTEATEEPAL